MSTYVTHSEENVTSETSQRFSALSKQIIHPTPLLFVHHSLHFTLSGELSGKMWLYI